MQGQIEEDFQEVTRYVDMLGGRSRKLASQFTDLEKDTVDSLEMIRAQSRRVHSQVSSLESEVSECKEQVRELQKVLLFTIQVIKASVRKDDLKKLESKVDRWGPERLVTRAEALKVFEKLA